MNNYWLYIMCFIFAPIVINIIDFTFTFNIKLMHALFHIRTEKPISARGL
jgi:hypothetical protein